LLKTKFIRYEKVYTNFAKFFDNDDLILRLDRKADIVTFDRLDALKANRLELHETKALIDNLNDRVKHLSII